MKPASERAAIYKKHMNSSIISFSILLVITVIICSGLIALCWLFSDLASAILATVLLIIILMGISYISLVEIIYKSLMKKYNLKNDKEMIIKTAKRFYNLVDLPVYKEGKLIDLAVLSLKYNNDEKTFISLYNKAKIEKNILVTLAFSHILYLVKHKAYEKGFNEYLAFKLKAHTTNYIDTQIDILTILFDYITTGNGMDKLQEYAKFIENEYFDDVLKDIENVRVKSLTNSK